MTFDPQWLALREPADEVARSGDLLEPLRARLNRDAVIVRDIGCGTGSMARWLSARIGGRQHWVLQDRDARLLAMAGATVTGPGVTAETRQSDLTTLRADDLADTDLVTASALLDLLTADEVAGLAAVCVDAGCPALLALSVDGCVDLDPAEPLDAAFADAFNEHQRREADGRRLLGPDAVGVAVSAFRRRGATVVTRPSPWRLGPDQAALAEQWLRGWVEAACEQRPELAEEAPAYLRRRLAAGLRVVVHHTDLLALPA